MTMLLSVAGRGALPRYHVLCLVPDVCVFADTVIVMLARCHSFFCLFECLVSHCHGFYSNVLISRLLPGRLTASGNRVARGGTQGGLNCLTHALPRCLPTPNSVEADGGGVTIDRAEASIGLPPRVLRIPPPVPTTAVTGVPTSGRLHHLPMLRCPGSTTTTTRRVSPDHLISK